MIPKIYFSLVILSLLMVQACVAQKTSVLFKYNMTYLIAQKKFDPNTDRIDIVGTFNNWQGGSQYWLTDSDKDGIYELKIQLTIGENIEFKGRINGQWAGREEFAGGGANRSYKVIENGIIELWYNDEIPSNALHPIIDQDQSIAKPGADIHFTDQSTGNPVSWLWEFEGGTPAQSTDQNPIINYAEVGVYGVTLKVVDANGKTAEKHFDASVRIDEMKTYWWNNTVFYEIFMRSFRDSDGDGKGDIQGLIEKLDYLNDGNPLTSTDLGIGGIWLMPIQSSPSYHGYDVDDYLKVDSEYGNASDFKQLISEAHNRGIKIIIDYVINHSSRDHAWFKNASSSPNAEKRNYYVWNATNPGNGWHLKNGSYYYGFFWEGMPDLNYKNDQLKKEIFDIAEFWLTEMQVDGFRIDAAKYLVENGNSIEDQPETIQFYQDFRNSYKAINPDAFTVGEVWSSTKSIKQYVDGTGMDYCFEFELSDQITSSIHSGNADQLDLKIKNSMLAYPFAQFGNFLSNHDKNRIMSSLDNDNSKAKLAANILFTLPGIPYIYYGEEIGMTGTKERGDEYIRTPMQWNNSKYAGFSDNTTWFNLNQDYITKNVSLQESDKSSLWSVYHDLITIRNQSIALQTGTYMSLKDDDDQVLSFMRSSEDENIVVIHNLSNTTKTDITIELLTDKLPQGQKRLLSLTNDKTYSITSQSKLEIDQISPRESLILRIEKSTAINDLDQKIHISVRPNPIKDFAFLDLQGQLLGTIQYYLYDIKGQIHGSGVLNHHQLSTLHKIDCGGLGSGIYTLYLQKDNSSFTQKLQKVD